MCFLQQKKQRKIIMKLLINTSRNVYKMVLRIPKPRSWNYALRRWARLSAEVWRRAEFAQLSSLLNPLPVVPFWETSLAEPTVLLALRDFVRAGDIVLDVGANGGAIAIPLGRLVGIHGTVVAFEASPRIIPYLLDNLVKHHAINVTPVHKAVEKQSGVSIPIFAGTHLNDSIYATFALSQNPLAMVETVALDDYCATHNIAPRVIKMDIEGAEYNALLGAQHIIRKIRPKLILEQNPEDTRCFEWLSGENYLAYDLAKYSVISTMSDYRNTALISNILYVHSDDSDAKHIAEAVRPGETFVIRQDQFLKTAKGIRLREPISLPAGRFVCTANWKSLDGDNEVQAGIKLNGMWIMRYHTNAQFLQNSYSEWVFDLRQESIVDICVDCLQGELRNTRWEGVVLRNVGSFGSQPVFTLQAG